MDLPMCDFLKIDIDTVEVFRDFVKMNSNKYGI